MQRSAIGTRPMPYSQAFQSSRTADCTAIGTGLGRPFLADDFERCACPTALVLQHRSEHRPAGVAFLQLGAEVVADLGENRREVLDRQSRKDLTPVFCDKDQMDLKMRISGLVNSLKAVSSRRLREIRPEVAGRYSKGVLWSPSYFAASCAGAPLSIIAEYVRNQREGALPPRPERRGFRAQDR